MTTVQQPRTTVSTRTLLACGALATPVFGVVSLAQVATREGFDLVRHPLSMLSNGDLGWLQITNFLVTAALTLAGSVGLRRVLRGTPGGRWAPRLVLVNGIGLVAAAVFVLQPGDGFPAGTPLGQPTTMTTATMLHLLAGSTAFVAIIAACLVLGHHYGRAGRRAVAAACRVAGLGFLAANAWSISGGYAGAAVLCVGSLLAMACVSVAALEQRSRI